MAKKKKNVGSAKKAAAKRIVPKTVQQSIPYIRVYDDTNTNGGIIETADGVFTKSYIISDTNYSDAGEERQESILQSFEKILSEFSIDCSYEITVNTRTIDQNEFNRKVLIQYQNNELDELRMQHNELVLEMMQEGKNNLKAEKYLTIAVNCETLEEALRKFAGIEKTLNLRFKKINQTGIEALSLLDRLEILHDIYNNGQEGTFSKKFNIDDIISQGITTKDVIGPTMMDFSKNDYIQIDDKFVRTLFLKAIPSTLTSSLLESFSDIAANTLISVHYEPQPQDKAASFASAQVTNIGAEVIKAQKNLTKAGASTELISPRLNTAKNDAKELLAEITNGNQSLFHITLVATVFADSKDDLDVFTEQIKAKGRIHLCTLDTLRTQQEQGFNTSLPLALNMINAHRIMLAKTAAAIQPFSTQELQQNNGYYYGLNQLSKNIIVFNRGSSINQNGVILGSPGSGKSFAAKMEMYQAYLNSTNSQLFIIDPEREYKVLAEKLGGTIIPIEPGSKWHLNPLDLDITRDDEGGDPLAQKVDFVIAIVESMLGGRQSLNGFLKTIIDSTLQDLYAPYIQQLEKRKITIDTELCPTLRDFHEMLRARKEPEAKNLAASIAMYCTGTMNIFAYHTNIDTSNRMIVYDTKHIGENLKELGMQVCLNDVWTRMIANKARNVRTNFYIDEFYLLLHQKSAAQYLQMVWKRARKWMGTPTGITQNVADLVASEEGQTILATSAFALMMTQAFSDRLALAQIFQLSEEQMDYITDANPGEGLLYTSKSTVPFENHVPTTSPIYKLLSTKAEDAEAAGEKLKL